MKDVAKGYVNGGCKEEDDGWRLVVLNEQLGGDAICADQEAGNRLARHQCLRVFLLWQQSSESVERGLLNGASDGHQTDGCQIDRVSGLSREKMPCDLAEGNED